ncbi:MAG: phage tail protein, partial [Sulfuritalea sp.]|nr:phage tail protein [Sulfuritalea sp.]
MTTLAFGAAGAAVGTALFPPGAVLFGLSGASLGWIAGSMIGAQLSAKDVNLSQEGPRLFDLKIQTSGYGQPIPWLFGRARIAGNVIWSSDLIEEAHTSSQSQGGKGGGDTTVTTTTYTYKVNLAVGVCRGPIIGIRRIWANGKLIYNLGASADANTVVASNARADGMRFYVGDTTQLPEPLIEATEGAGNVPAYRNLAYVVLEDFQLADFGNRIPNFEFEVLASGSAAQPAVVATIPTTDGATGYPQTLSWDNGLYTVGLLTLFQNGGFTATSRLKTYDLNGNLIKNQATTRSYSTITAHPQPMRGDWHGVTIRDYNSAGDAKWWNIESNTTSPAGWQSDSSATIPQLWKGSQYAYFYYKTTANAFIAAKIAIQGDLPGPSPEKTVQVLGSSLIHHSFWDGTSFWIANSISGALKRYDSDLELVETYSYTTPGAEHGYIYVYDDLFYIGPTSALGARLFRLNDDLTTTLISSAQLDPDGSVTTFPATPGIVIGRTKIQSVLPSLTNAADTLSNIVTALCEESGLSASDIDVSALTDNVTGYVIAKRGPLRAALEPLMAAYLFDGVESDGKLKFVKRGGASVVTIPTDDLNARPAGTAPGDPVSHSRDEDVGLPVEIAVLFFNDNADYQQGAQYARRLTSQADSRGTFELPVVLTDEQAKRIADAQLFDAWAARDAISFSTSREYAKYEPGDVVTITLGTAPIEWRITKRDDGANGVIQWEAVYADASVYTQSAETQSAVTPSQTLSLRGPTNLELMDIPLLRDADDAYGFYAAAGGYLDGWRGAQLFMSRDGGSSYDDVEAGTFLSEASIGYADTALGSTLPFGNEQFDETNTVDVTLISGELSSVTRDQVLDGSNVALLGSEIIQFKTATLLSAGKYRLSSLLRGRLGTDHAISGHAINERFVLIERSTLRF